MSYLLYPHILVFIQIPPKNLENKPVDLSTALYKEVIMKKHYQNDLDFKNAHTK